MSPDARPPGEPDAKGMSWRENKSMYHAESLATEKVVIIIANSSAAWPLPYMSPHLDHLATSLLHKMP